MYRIFSGHSIFGNKIKKFNTVSQIHLNFIAITNYLLLFYFRDIQKENRCRND